MTDLADAALAYVQRGHWVLPLQPRDKRPLAGLSWDDASDDPEVVAAWWEEAPEANIGLACNGDLVVLDVDGEQGRATLAKLEAEYGAMASGYRVTTGDGEHRYLRRNGSDLPGWRWDGLELKASGYVVAPPSVHPNGGRYTATGTDGSWPDVPEWVQRSPKPQPEPRIATPGGQDHERLRKAAEAAQAGELEKVRAHGSAPGSGRHTALYACCCALGRHEGAGGLAPAELLATAEQARQLLGLPDDAATRHQVEHGREDGLAEPYVLTERTAPAVVGATAPAADGRAKGLRMRLTPASEIPPARVRWLAPERLALRSLAVYAGPPGVGKSTLVEGQLAAGVTLGTLGGDVIGPRDVLVASIEDDWPTVIVPRAMAYGADRTRLHRMELVDADDRPRPISLPSDVPALATTCRALRDMGRPVGLVIIDPLGAHLDSGVDSYRDASVRRALGPLADMAMRLDLVVVGIAHLTKDDSKRLLDRVAGSVAFGGAPRSVLVFMRDPSDPEGEEGDLRVLAHAKANWGRYAPTLSARVESRLVDLPDGGQADIGHVVLLGNSTVRREELSGAEVDADHADTEEAVAAALANGARPSRDVKAQVARELHCNRRTVGRAAHRMQARGELVVEQGGFPRTTTWALTVGTRGGVPTGGVPTVPTEESGSAKPDPGGVQLQWGHDPDGVPTGPTSAIHGPTEETA